MSTVSPPQVVAPEDGQATELSHRVQEALGELAGAAKEGLMALSVVADDWLKVGQAFQNSP